MAPAAGGGGGLLRGAGRRPGSGPESPSDSQSGPERLADLTAGAAGFAAAVALAAARPGKGPDSHDCSHAGAAAASCWAVAGPGSMVNKPAAAIQRKALTIRAWFKFELGLMINGGALTYR